MKFPRLLLGLALIPAFFQISGCGKDASVEILNVSYDPTRELYKEFNDAFVAKQKAKGVAVRVTSSNGGSGAQTRAVIDGLKADVVTLALGGDIDALAHKGLVAEDWETRLPNNSAPYTSTIVFLVRKGNPKNIKDWPDLIRDDVKVITPNPKTSGGAKYNFLGAWGFVTLHQKKSEEEAEAFIRKLYQNVPKLDTGARGATDTFARGKTGDVFISWENEAILAQRELAAEKFEIVYPSVSILAEPPVAVVDKVVDAKKTRALAEEYLTFLYSPEGQEIIAKHSYRPRNAEAAKKLPNPLPDLPMFTIRDVAGSWANASKKFFGDGALFDKIYQPKGAK